MTRTTLALTAGALMLASAGSLAAQSDVEKQIQATGTVSSTLLLSLTGGAADLGTINTASEFGSFAAAVGSNTLNIKANTNWKLTVDPVGSGGTTITYFDYCTITAPATSCTGSQSPTVQKSLLNDLRMQLTPVAGTGASAPTAYATYAGLAPQQVASGGPVMGAEYGVGLQSIWYWTNPPGQYSVTIRFTLAAN